MPPGGQETTHESLAAQVHELVEGRLVTRPGWVRRRLPADCVTLLLYLHHSIPVNRVVHSLARWCIQGRKSTQTKEIGLGLAWFGQQPFIGWLHLRSDVGELPQLVLRQDKQSFPSA